MNIFGQLYDKVGDGWHPLLDTFDELVRWDIEFNGMPPVEVTGVDEKQGSLRIYFSGGNKQTDAYASFAKMVSNRIPED